ncbi:MAG: hypothetical protein IKE91_05525 [Clostridia bacterium]|nr:hypothetical protein [Clostridia bacterium]
MFWVILILIVVVPVVLVFRGMGRANGWIYDFLQEFFYESLDGHPHRGSFSRLLALVGSVVVVLVVIGLIVLFT